MNIATTSQNHPAIADATAVSATSRMSRQRLRTTLMALAVAVGVLLGISLAATPANAAALYTATATVSNTGSASASITLWRWTGSAWVNEKTGTTSSSGAATFRYVRGAAYYMWTTQKSASYYDAGSGTWRGCYFYTRSNPGGTGIPAGTTRTVAFYQAWNTCGA